MPPKRLMALETESLCGGAPSERTPERQNLRNGYRDRGYGRVRNFAHTQARGAAFITRIGWRSVRLFHPSGEAFDLIAALSDTGPGVAEHPLTIGSGPRAVPARLVLARKPAEAAKRSRTTGSPRR